MGKTFDHPFFPLILLMFHKSFIMTSNILVFHISFWVLLHLRMGIPKVFPSFSILFNLYGNTTWSVRSFTDGMSMGKHSNWWTSIRDDGCHSETWDIGGRSLPINLPGPQSNNRFWMSKNPTCHWLSLYYTFLLVPVTFRRNP